MAAKSIKFGADARESLLLDRDDYDYGFDAQSGAFTDMVAAGIIDPTKVVRIALQNAASVAGMLIATQASVSELSDKVPDGDRGGHVR